jgi:ABC-type glycerol-3-phosphate transport system substrate-binding protein
LNGESPYNEALKASLKRSWEDEGGVIPRDSRDNDIIPKQVEVYRWDTARLTDRVSFLDRPYALYLERGEHTLSILLTRDDLAVGQLTLSPPIVLPSYAQVAAMYEANGYKPVDAELSELILARTPTLKSDQSLYAVFDRSGPATIPYDVSKIRRNIIGGGQWHTPGMWIMFEYTAPESGLYQLCLKYRQNHQPGRPSYRSIYINGKIPFQEFESIAFAYSTRWNNWISPYLLYFEKGERVEIRIEVTLGDCAPMYQEIDNLNYELNALYRRIIMAAGADPDPLRDYQLEMQIPGLADNLRYYSARIFEEIAKIQATGAGQAGDTEVVRRAAAQLEYFADRIDRIPMRLASFRENISAISNWLIDISFQMLDLNYIIVGSPYAEIPSPRATFWQSLKHFFLSFIASFFEDYDSISDDYGAEAITVWSGFGRDQTQILKELIDSYFTKERGIHVNLRLLQGGLIEAKLAGRSPDVVVGLGRGQPVNLACRGALMDLSGFPGFEGVTERFAPTSMVPYTWNDGVYALPNTQSFFMMFYRTDIFEELGITPPDTWDDFMDVTKILLRHNMRIGLPYAPITAPGAVDGGLGSKDLFPLLLLQKGGSFYTEDLRRTALDSPEALEAFVKWVEFYTKYDSLLEFFFNSRFRSGEMPLGIATYETYLTFSLAAPEIRGLWAMAPVPGMLKEDGTIDRTVGSSGSASVILSDASNPDACWEFLKWWTSDEIQFLFGQASENVLGLGGRYSTANLDAFSRLGWSKEELEMITYQRSYLREVPEVPGSYYISRSIDNAFRTITINFRNPREALEWENRNINIELERKRIELEGFR